MKILITGGNGFIARNIYKKLKNKYNIHCLGKEELNLLDYKKVLSYIKSNNFDVIIHTATYDAIPKHSTNDPSKVLENHLKMFFNIIRCNNYFGKMIYFGSGAEYCRDYWKPKMKEDYFDMYVPKDQYGFAKYLMTKYTLLKNNIYNLRLFSVFGEDDDFKVRLISNICRNVSLNLPIVINKNKYYDFLYINDLVKIVEWFINNKPKHNVYNVCTGNVTSFKNIANKILKISGKNLSINIKDKKLGEEYSGDNSLLLKEINGFKFISIDDAIKNIYKYFKCNKKIFEKKLVEDCYGYA